ncbi:MAG: Ferritin Dps family protein [Verrucomicrobiales bacterium]|nr:Ferritin Dps family protein [Verrucomicrobiales bacterium]
MNTSTTQPAVTNPVVGALSTLLGDSYSLMGETHLAHWNVEGSAFFELHGAFQKQYEELFEAVDDIAERIRAIDAYAPGGLKALAKLSTVPPVPTGAAPAKDFVAALIEGHETTTESAKKVRDTAAETGDLETQDLAIGRVRVHQKTLWMLRSYLKNL